MERHVLVVLPHPDDETFGAGGVIAFYTKQGVPVTYVCATLGQMGQIWENRFLPTGRLCRLFARKSSATRASTRL